MSEHDRWLANYQMTEIEVWCSNQACQLHRDGISVTYEEENGQGWTTPEDCPLCHHDFLYDEPEREDE